MTEELQPLQFNNDNLTVTQTNLPHCQVKVEVTLSPQKSESCYLKALKAVTKEVIIPGFRKGRAPKEMIQDKYQAEINREFRNQIGATLSEVFELIAKFPIHQDAVSIKSISAQKEGASSFIAQFETVPSVPKITPENFDLAVLTSEQITEKEVENTVKNLCYEHGVWEHIENRPSQSGDFVTVDVEQMKDEDWVTVSEGVHLHLDQATEKSWILDALTGASIDNFIEAARPPEEGEEPDEVTYRFHVTNVRSCQPLSSEQLPEKLKLPDLDAATQKIKEELEKSSQMELKDKQRNLVYDYLKEHVPFDLPSLLVEIELAHKKERLKEKIVKENGDPSVIDDAINKDKEHYKEATKEILRAELLLQEFVRERNVISTEIEMREHAQLMMRDMERLMEMMQNPDEFTKKLKNESTRCKALDMIYQEATAGKADASQTKPL